MILFEFAMMRTGVFMLLMVLLCAWGTNTSAIYGQTMPDSALFEKHLLIGENDTLPYLTYLSDKAKKQDSSVALVVFLHGAGERGNDNYRQLYHCVRFFLSDTVSGRYPFLLLLPQCPENQRWVNTDWRLPSHQMEPNATSQLKEVMTVVDSLIATNTIDARRIYFCGISMGGFGVWDALQRHPDKIAAAIAICGGGDPAYAHRMKDIPLYIFHGEKDKLVKPSRSHQMYQTLKEMHSKDLHYITFPDMGHLCWDKALATPGLFQWLFSKQKNGQQQFSRQ